MKENVPFQVKKEQKFVCKHSQGRLPSVQAVRLKKVSHVTRERKETVTETKVLRL